MIIAGFFLGVALLVFGVISAGGSLGLVFDPASIIMVLVPGLALVLMTGNGRSFVNGLKVALSPSRTFSRGDAVDGAHTFDLLTKVTIAAGTAVGILGLSLILINAVALELAARSSAIALLAPVYAIVLAFFLWFPIKKVFEKKRDSIG